MNTFSYGPVPTLSKQSTPKNALEGEEASQRFLTPSGHHAQLSRKKENDGPIYTPNGVHALLQRVNGNAPPTITRIRKAPGTNLMFPACDAVRWKTTAQREAERAEAMRLQAEEEEKKKKAETEEEAEEEEEDVLCTQEKRKSLSSQLLPSFVVASRDANKENVDVTHNVPHVKKLEHVSKNALEVPLKTRGNDADVVVVLDWKKQKAETDDDDEADFVRASLTPPKGGEKKKSGDDKSSGKRCVDARVRSAALSARDGKKARIDVVGERTREKQKLRSSEQILLQRTRTLEKQMHTLSSRLDTMEKVLVETINSRFEETNGFVFEVLTAMASTSSLSRRAD